MLARLLLSVCAVFSAFGTSAAEVDKTEPYKMMKQVAEVTFERLKAEQPKIKQDPDLLKVIVEEELMPYVNYRYAGLKLLGPNLKGAKREDVLEFIDAFRAYLKSHSPVEPKREGRVRATDLPDTVWSQYGTLQKLWHQPGSGTEVTR